MSVGLTARAGASPWASARAAAPVPTVGLAVVLSLDGPGALLGRAGSGLQSLRSQSKSGSGLPALGAGEQRELLPAAVAADVGVLAPGERACAARGLGAEVGGASR